MSDESILHRYTGEREATDEDGEPACDLRTFGWLRGIKDRALTLELRKKDGSIVAVSYSHLDRFEFDPSAGITISTGGAKIRIRGRNLNAEMRPAMRLFEGLCRHRVPWIREADATDRVKAGEKETVVERIEA